MKIEGNTLSIRIDPDCEHCQQVLKAMQETWETKNDQRYGTYEFGSMRRVPAFELRPDYNGCGLVTHWHMTKEGA